MKFSTITSMIVLACAGLAAAAPAAVQERCEACEESCASTHFWYTPGQCCLPHGGPPKVVTPPIGIACPTNWYYHTERSCCSPKLPTYQPTPKCETSTFPNWNPRHECCEKPSGPSGPQPSPKPKPNPKPYVHWDKRSGAHVDSHKNRLVLE